MSKSEEFLVRDYMTSPAAALSHTDSLLDAELLFRRTGFRHVPIVDNGRLVGILSDRDVTRLAPSMVGKISPEEYNDIFEKTRLEKAMTREVITINPETRVVDAAAILHQKKIGCLPVVEDGRLVGIITTTDMLAVLLQILSSEKASNLKLEKA